MLVPGADDRLQAIGTGGAARQALRLVLAGLVIGMLLGATPLRQWAEALPNMRGTATIQAAAVAWDAGAAQLGLTSPYAALRAWLRGIEGTPWP